jgi:arginine exporter protein ArgO
VLEAALAGIVAGYAIAIPVGAIAVLILHTGIQHGLGRALAAAGGAATADGVYAAVAVTLGLAAADLVSPVETPLRLVAAIVLLGFGARGLLSIRGPRETLSPQRALAYARSNRWTYLALLGLTLLNPITVAYFAALVMGLPSLGGALEHATFVVAVFVSSLSWQVLLAVVGSALGRGPGQRMRVPSIIIGNVVILALGLVILIDVLRG